MSTDRTNSRRSLAIGAAVLASVLGAGIGTAGVAAAAGSPNGATGGGSTTTSTTASSTTSTGVSTTAKGGNKAAGSTSVSSRPAFEHAKQLLLQQLALRSPQLQRLQQDVSSSQATLSQYQSLPNDSDSDYVTLSTRLATEVSDMATLTTAANSATTWAALDQARKSMLVDNRVFAVMTPQVILTIEADSLTTSLKGLQGDEPGLQSAVDSLTGLPGYKNADNHYVTFVKLVTGAYARSTGVAARVLAAAPQGWPGNQRVFVDSNKAMLAVGEAIARANYDATLIGLETGGYTGS